MKEFTKNILIVALVASFTFVCYLADQAQRKVTAEQLAANAHAATEARAIAHTKSLRGAALQLSLAQDLACVAPRSTAKIYVGTKEVVCSK